MPDAYFSQFDAFLVDADGVRTPAAGEDIDIHDVETGDLLDTVTSDADGVVASAAVAGSAAEQLVEFRHATYPGKMQMVLKATLGEAFSAFDADGAAYELENLSAKTRSSVVKLLARDKNSNAPPFELQVSGKAGTTSLIPYQSTVDQDLEIFPISYTEELAQATARIDTNESIEVAVPATGGGSDEFLYLGRDYADDSQAAIDDNPTDPIVLRVENLDVSVTDNITWPNNITLDFHAGGSFEVAEKKRVTIAKAINMDPATRYFRPATATGSTISSVNTGTETLTTSAAHGLSVGDAVFFTTTGALPGGLITNSTFYVLTVPSSTTLTVGVIPDGTAVNLTSSGSGTNKVVKPGEVVLERNATGGENYVAWWADDESAEDDNHAVNQARKSVENGGKVYFGDRLYYIDNQQIVECMWVEGVGNDIDGSGYSSTYTGKGTRFVPSNLASTNPLWFAKDYFRNCGIRNCSLSPQQSETAHCLGIFGNFAPNTGGNPHPTSGVAFLAENVSFHSYLANSNPTLALQRPLVKMDGTASWAEEVVLEFRHCTALAAGEYTNLYYIRSTNTGVLFHGGSVTASTGGIAYDLEAAGWVKWTHGDERKGSPAYTLTTTFDRNLTCNLNAASRLLTATSGTFEDTDTSQNVVKATNIPANAYITEVISPTVARISAANSDFTGQTVAVNRYGKTGSSTLGYAVIRVRGSGSTLTYDGGADEAFEHFLVYERGQFGGVINIKNRLIQSALTFKYGLGTINLNGCDIYSGALNDLPGEWSISSVDTGTDTLTLSSNHAFLPGQTVGFSTTGSLPGGLSASTPYYVISVPGPNQVIVSATLGGSAVNLTSSGSNSTLFNSLDGINPLGGGSCSVNVNPCYISRFSLVNYLTTERPVLWQRREGSSGLIAHTAWYEDYDIDTTGSTFRQVREVPLPITFYDPNPSAASDETGAVTTTIHENSGKTLRRWGQGSLTGGPKLDYGFYDQRNISTGDWDIISTQGASFEISANFTNMGVRAARGCRGTDGSYPNGYTAAAVGSVTQATSKSTGVTLNKSAGRITMHGAALGAGTTVSFTLTNNAIAATDHINAWIVGGEILPFTYLVKAVPGSGSATFTIKNDSTGAASEAVVIAFEVVKTPI